jgi:CRISPR system Cascade subunit CasD
MDSQYLLLWLEAPLQSWGADSRFGRRDSLPFPTKSGIAGMLLCALGASGEQTGLLARLAPLRQTVISFLKAGTKPAEREPLLRDFQMVGSGYDGADPWGVLHVPKTADGGKAVGGGTKMTYRYYLQDARFAATVEVPEDIAESLAVALQNPAYDLYLGRKNCVPTEFVFQGRFPSEEPALAAAIEIAVRKELREDFRVIDGEHDGEPMTINDVPVQFGLHKVYRDRRVTRIQT